MPFETCEMRWLMPQPCMGSSVSVLRTRRSSVPRRTSDWLVGAMQPSVGFLQQDDVVAVGSQQERVAQIATRLRDGHDEMIGSRLSPHGGAERSVSSGCY